MKSIMRFGLSVLFFQTVTASFFDVEYPNVFIQAEPQGNLTLEAGVGGNVILRPGNNRSGTVFIENMDLRKLVERVTSLPPVWIMQSEHDLLGTFLAGSFISVHVRAEDPEGGPMKYQLISGALPPAVLLSPTDGHIYGPAPDEDATYTFGIRAIDPQGRFADGIFIIGVRQHDQCLSKPCQHGGSCTDMPNAHKCTCSVGYGGAECQFDCLHHALGVNVGEKTIPDAQMSAYLSEGTSVASRGRLNGTGGWIGVGSGSWLQVDLGAQTEVSAVAAQGDQSESYIISSYQVQYSQDGNGFTSVLDLQGHAMTFGGSTHYDSIIKHNLISPILARFVRFVPVTWKSNPGMRVEIYGCKAP